MKDNKKISVNLFLFVFLFYSFVILITDYITYAVKFNYITSVILSSIIMLFVSLLLVKKKKIIINKNFSKYDFVFMSLMFFIFIISFVYPDRTFDTINYHIYIQENPFGDKIFNDFFPARWINSYTYAFSDRFAYFFRYIFGYRVGILFNYFIITAIYYEVKKIVINYLPIKKDMIISLVSILCTLTLSTVELLDSYYIDNLSIVFLLELFYITFCCKYDKDYTLPFIFILCGFSISTKISNAFIIITLAIMYLIKHHKELKNNISIKVVVKSILLFIIPCGVYIYYTFKSTGNPFFPFYNTIFKSDFYANNNWIDHNFGPKSIIETLIWPIVMEIKPFRTYDLGIVELSWAISYIICVINSIKALIKKLYLKEKINSVDVLYISTTILYLVWTKFMLGYTRYGLVILILGSICTFVYIINLFINRRIKFFIIFLIVILVNYSNQLYTFVSKANWYSFNNYFSKEYKNTGISYIKNLEYIFDDRDIELNFENNSVIGIVYTNSAYAELVSEGVPIISLNDGVSNEYTKQLLNNSIRNKKIYTILDCVDYEKIIKYLNKSGYRITSIKGVYSPKFINNNNYLYIYEIEKTNKKNVIYDNQKKFVVKQEGLYNISGVINVGLYTRVWNPKDYDLVIMKNNEIIKKISLKDKKGININESLSLKKDDTIDVVTISKIGEKDLYPIKIINFE